ncbi:MAG: hypothetical protein IT242_01530 [Bacteroidia bacterium]|nr:hypothetical protein [Bacteroidia bacterium]
MKHMILCSTLCLLLFSSCTKTCPNMNDGPLTPEERLWLIRSSRTLYFANQAGDSLRVDVEAPVYTNVPMSDPECDHTGNQYAEQVYHFTSLGTFTTHLDHYTAEGDTRFVKVDNTSQVFRFDIRALNYYPIWIHSNAKYKTLMDSAASTPIRKMYYGKEMGILRIEMQDGTVWDQQ